MHKSFSAATSFQNEKKSKSINILSKLRCMQNYVTKLFFNFFDKRERQQQLFVARHLQRHKNCGQTYIVETARNLEVRVTQNQTPKSKVLVGSFNHRSFVDEKENKRNVLHCTFPYRPSQKVQSFGLTLFPVGRARVLRN